MTDVLVLGLLSIALASGYFLGRKHKSFRRDVLQNQPLSWPQQRYYQGLTQLLNDQTDAAIDTFIEALDVNSETLETHLALGSLLRKRGEVSRAIRVHQNLLSRSGLSKAQNQNAQLELGIDYMRAGLLDRAESLFKDLINLRDVEKQTRIHASQHLLEVYQELREWLLAIDIADRLTGKKFAGAADKWREVQAHYSCEIAEASIDEKDWLTARRWLRTALRYDKKCVRAALLSAQLEMAQEDYALAISILRKVPQQNSAYASEILSPLFECYKKVNNLPGYLQDLAELYKRNRELMVLRYLAKATEAVKGGDAVVALLMEELPHYPDMEPAGELLGLVSDERGPQSLRNYVRIKGVLEKLTDSRHVYSCEHCGFSGSQLHWLCPGCKSWATVRLEPKKAKSL